MSGSKGQNKIPNLDNNEFTVTSRYRYIKTYSYIRRPSLYMSFKTFSDTLKYAAPIYNQSIMIWYMANKVYHTCRTITTHTYDQKLISLELSYILFIQFPKSSKVWRNDMKKPSHHFN